MGNTKKTWLHRLQQRRSANVALFAILVGIAYYLVFFIGGSNFREVVPDKVYRSAQPSPAQLKKWIQQHEIKTVINLRGDVHEITEDEQAVTEQMGVKMVTIRLSGYGLTPNSLLNKLMETIETAEQPILLHCHAGVDRSGMASTLAAMAIGGECYDKARCQAYVPPGPWKRKKQKNYVHISDILKFYESYCLRNELDTDGWQQFKRWAIDIYNPTNKQPMYKLTCSYLPQLGEGKRFYPIGKLISGAYVPFAVELVVLSLLVIIVYRRLSKN